MFKRIEDVIRNESVSFYVIVDTRYQLVTFGIIMDTMGQHELHTCAYLNVDKLTYITVTDWEFVRQFDITFDNVPSNDISIPSSIRSQFTIDEQNYWIGIDSMGMGIRIHDAMASRLQEIFYEYNNRISESSPDSVV